MIINTLELKIRANTIGDGLVEIVDVDTNGSHFYIEISPHHAKELVSRWNTAPKLLEACERTAKRIYEVINDRAGKTELSRAWHDLDQAIQKAKE